MDKKAIKDSIKKIKEAISMDLKNASNKKAKYEIKKNAYKRFDIIYENYGQKAYYDFVPSKYRKKDIKQLLKEQRFLSIYNKHGKNAYNDHLVEMKSQDIQYESGSKLKKFSYLMRHFLRTGAFSAAATITLALPPAAIYSADNAAKGELKQYEVEIEEYLNHIEVYGEDVKKYNFSDLENVMYIMDDMWQGTLGYGEPSLDLTSYPGLDMADSEGYGVCRNMADDFARKLNAIDNRYNARVMEVYSHGKQYEFPDIERKEHNQNNEEQDSSALINLLIKATGNHALVIFHSIEDDVELIADPTNPGIGIFCNGEIDMFNSYGEEPRVNEYRPITSIFYGVNRVAQIPENYIEGMGIYTEKKMKLLKDKYCVDKQNEAIQKIRGKKTISFYDSVRVDIDSTNLDKDRTTIGNQQVEREESKDLNDEIR